MQDYLSSTLPPGESAAFFLILNDSSLTIKFENCSSSILFFQLNDRSDLLTIMMTDFIIVTSTLHRYFVRI